MTLQGINGLYFMCLALWRIDKQGGTVLNHCEYKNQCSLASGKICGTDGFTYADECKFFVEKCSKQPTLEKAYLGECRKYCNGVECLNNTSCVSDKKGTSLCILRHCPTTCDESEKVICGSNNKTYQSTCHMKQDSCRSKQIVFVKYLGKCRDDISCSVIQCQSGHSCVTKDNGKPLCIKCCNTTNIPLQLFDICGSNGKVYRDWCDIQKESCAIKKFIKVDFSWQSCNKQHGSQGFELSNAQ